MPDSTVCQLCRAGGGTLFHRRFKCSAWEGDRRTFLSSQCRAAARFVRELGMSGESFACGIFPFPRELIPPALRSEACDIC
eukprot:7873560-Pyramimonas_sp.AAC.1